MTTTTLLAAPAPTADGPHPRRGPRRSVSLVLALAGGLATESAFPARSWWPMAYVGIALLLHALRRDSVRWGFLTGGLFGLAFFLPHLWWASEGVGEPIGWIALSAMEASSLGGFGPASGSRWLGMVSTTPRRRPRPTWASRSVPGRM